MNLAQSLDYFNIKSLENYTFEQLKIDYKNLAKKYHPDMNQGNHEAFVKLRQAYHLISENINTQNVENTSRTTFGRIRRGNSPLGSTNSGFSSFSQNNNAASNSGLNSNMNADLQVQLQILYGETKNASLEAKEKFESLWESFTAERGVLIENMEKELLMLKKRRGFFSLLFFWAGDNMIRKNLNYQIKLNEYQQKLYDLDTSYLKEVVKMYSEVLNNLSYIVNKESA